MLRRQPLTIAASEIRTRHVVGPSMNPRHGERTVHHDGGRGGSVSKWTPEKGGDDDAWLELDWKKA